MRFTELSDYDYSEGETSEDMKMQSGGISMFPSSGKFNVLQVGFHLPIDKQLEAVDQSFGGNNMPSNLPSIYQYENISQNYDNGFSSDPDSDPVECVVLSLTRPIQYKIVKSEYIHETPPIIAWTEATPSLDPKTLHSFYKLAYQQNRSQIRFVSYIPPFTDKFVQISTIRRDVPSGRIVFHYIGFGYPGLENGKIYASDPKTLAAVPCSLKDIFSNLRPPAWYILDCNNAASALPIFQKAAAKMIEKNSSIPSSPISTTPAYLRQINWNDYYCMCATDVDEELPIDPRLPKDLLSIILATPVTAALLFHILEFYRTSFPNPDFPFSHLKTVLAYGSTDYASLESILHATIDSIACETLEPRSFTKLFRKDKTTRIYFTNFVLAKFLLGTYGVHPKSYPELPDMNRNPLWKHWQTAADMWITSTLTPKPSLRTAFFTNALATLESLLKLKRQDEVTTGLLATVCHAPFADPTCSKAFSLLAEYVSHGKDYIEKLMKPFLFGQSAERLCSYMDSTHPLAFLLLTLLNANPLLIGEMSPILDISKLTKAILDSSICQETRALITAFVVVTIDKIRCARQIVCAKQFVEELSHVIKTAKPFFLCWCMMLFATAFQHTPIDISQINDDAIHLQIAAGVRHKSAEVRSAALLALSALLQPTDSTINGVLLMHAAPAIADIVPHVRHSLLMFVLRFIECESAGIVNYYHEEKLINVFDSFASFLTAFIPFNTKKDEAFFLGFGSFKDYAIAVDKVQKDTTTLVYTDNLALYLLQQLATDPYQPIASKAKISQSYTKKILDGIKHEYSDDEDSGEFDDPMAHDPLTFEAMLLDQLSRTGLFAPSPYVKPAAEPIPVRDYGAFDLDTAHLQLRAQTKLPAKPICHCSIPGMLGIAVASDDGYFRLYDDNFSYATEFKLGSICDCDSVKINELPIIVTVNDTGCATIINSKIMKIYATFSVTMNHSAPQKYFVKARRTSIYFCDERGYLSKFDTIVGFCSGEWNVGVASSKVTAFYAHPTSENVVIIGYENGCVKAFDTATGIDKSLVLTLDGKIVSITGKDDGLVYIGSSNGRILVWDETTNIMNTCGPKYKGGVLQFACHKKLPFFIISPPNELPLICHDDLTITHTLTTPTQKGSMFAMSDECPVICMLSESGEILSYNLIQ